MQRSVWPSRQVPTVSRKDPTPAVIASREVRVALLHEQPQAGDRSSDLVRGDVTAVYGESGGPPGSATRGLPSGMEVRVGFRGWL